MGRGGREKERKERSGNSYKQVSERERQKEGAGERGEEMGALIKTSQTGVQ